MQIKKLTFLFNRHNQDDRDWLATIPANLDIDIVDIYTDSTGGLPLEGMYSGFDWVTSGGTIQYRGVASVVITDDQQQQTVVELAAVGGWNYFLEIIQ